MKVYYDLHIHSALSPCAEEEMTPNNIVNMSVIKGLDVIAVCDHNNASNVVAVSKVAKGLGISFIPGVEVTTSEEVHVLALFSNADQATKFGELIYDALPNIANKPDFFGRQYIMDENDEIIGEKEKLLISATHYSFDECCDLIKEYGGIYIPAHVNKDANALLANLGFFPPHIEFPAIEVWLGGMPLEKPDSLIIHDSDAHMLDQISERENFLELESGGRRGVLEALGMR